MIDSEFALMKAIAQGDQQAFECVVKRYQDPLYNFVCRYLGDRCTAEDIVQEVFLRVYRSAPRFDPKGSVSTWIFRIAYNLSMNELKRRSRFRSLSERVHCLYEEERRGIPTGSETHDELHEEVMVALGALSEDQRAALLLRVNEGLSYREISGVLGVSVGSVESLLFRARRSLRQSLRREKKKQKE